jgi:hypothetical protein
MNTEETKPADIEAPEEIPPLQWERRWQRQKPWRLVLVILVALLAAAASAGAIWWVADYSRKQPVRSSGGIPFFKRTEIAMPQFRQADPAWSFDPLGPSDGTLGTEGCAVASVAMVFAGYGIDTDPKRLNEFLTAHEGYTPQGWLYWEKAAELAPDRVRHVYEDLPSYRLIDQNLARGNPVIVRLRFPGGGTHFVVVCGKAGFDYLIRDPGAGARKGVYPLRELTPRVEALRFYQVLKP